MYLMAIFGILLHLLVSTCLVCTEMYDRVFFKVIMITIMIIKKFQFNRLRNRLVRKLVKNICLI